MLRWCTKTLAPRDWIGEVDEVVVGDVVGMVVEVLVGDCNCLELNRRWRVIE